jgi:hypothetical protein
VQEREEVRDENTKSKSPPCPSRKPERQGRGNREMLRLLVAIVVVLVPVTLRMPAMLMLVPPSVTLTPATLARRVQFATLAVGLSAVTSVTFDGLMEIMLCVNDSPLAAVVVFGVELWDGGEKQRCCQHDC